MPPAGPIDSIVLVANPRAGAGSAARLLPELQRALEQRGVRVSVRRTTRMGEASDLVRAALREGATGVGIVGGDGTFNEAVNGYFEAPGVPVVESAWLGLFPSGTGGDFRRTLELARDAEGMARDVVHGRPRTLDVGWLTYRTHDGREARRAFLNITSFGLGGIVDQIVERGPKWLGGTPAFFLAAVRAMARYTPQRVRVRLDDEAPWELPILNVAVANGRYFGGGMHVAPGAKPDDGLFDVVAIGPTPLLQQLRESQTLYRGTHLALSHVRHGRARRVIAESLGQVPVLLDVDGEALGTLPATFEVSPSSLVIRC